MSQRERDRTDETPVVDGAATDESSVPGVDRTFKELPKVPVAAPSLLDPEEGRPVPTEPRPALSSDTMVMEEGVAPKTSDTMVMDPVEGPAATTDNFTPLPAQTASDVEPVPTDTRPAMSKAEAAAALFVNADEVPTDSMTARSPVRTKSGQIRAQGGPPVEAPRTRSGQLRAQDGGSVQRRSRSLPVQTEAPAPSQTDEVTGPKRVPTGSIPAQTDEVTGPKRTRSGQIRAQNGDGPRRTKSGQLRAQTGGQVLKAAQMPGEVAPVATRPPEKFQLGPVHVALGGGVFAVLLLVLWLAWPALTRSEPPPSPPLPLPVVPELPKPVAVAEPPKAKPEPVLEAVDPTPTPPPAKANEFVLDAKVHVIEPLAIHAPDVALNASHKYRLFLKTKGEEAGVMLARLEDEKTGWGVLNRLGSQPLVFGGAKTLRLHCEPGTVVKAETTVLLELQDLARKTDRRELEVKPAQHCWDFEVARPFPLTPGTPKRIRLPPEQTAVLGEQVPVKVAWQVQTTDSPPTFRAGVLSPGDDVLLDGVAARLAILDPWRGDNEGQVKLEILDSDIDSRGLVRPGKR